MTRIFAIVFFHSLLHISILQIHLYFFFYGRHDSIFGYMQKIIAGDDSAVKNGKPAPDIYIEAAKQLHVHPNNCLVFEDALSGVRSAKAAGCKVVAIPDHRFSSRERELFIKEADVVLDSLWQFDGKMFGLCVNMKTIQNDISPKTIESDFVPTLYESS